MMDDLGVLSGNDYSILTSIIERLNEYCGMDIAETDNIEHTILLAHMKKVAKALSLKEAEKEIEKIEVQLALKSFHKTRIKVFQTPSAELHIWNKEYGNDLEDFKEVIKEMFYRQGYENMRIDDDFDEEDEEEIEEKEEGVEEDVKFVFSKEVGEKH